MIRLVWPIGEAARLDPSSPLAKIVGSSVVSIRFGNVRAHMMMIADLEPGIDCWEWRGYCNDKGYGQVWIGGKTVLVHVYAYYRCFGYGSDPDRPELNHMCRNRRCWNPTHLVPVDRLENVRFITRDHCKRGHPWHPDTTYVKPGSGERCCKICRRAYRRDRYHMRKNQSA